MLGDEMHELIKLGLQCGMSWSECTKEIRKSYGYDLISASMISASSVKKLAAEGMPEAVISWEYVQHTEAAKRIK